MLTRLIKRLATGLLFALALGLLGAFVGEARSPQQEPPSDECLECHETVVTHWSESAHGQAAADPVFQEAWQTAGSPPECLSCHTTLYDPTTGAWLEEGIACAVCHSPAPSAHPELVMPTDLSSQLCGSCHVDTHDEWQTSGHGEADMTCVRCHNPHTTSLKAGSVQEVCQTCHNEEGHYFSYTPHAEAGLLCTDCHLRVSDAPPGEGHGQRLHTFAVNLATCAGCHGEEMHFPVVDEEDDGQTPLFQAEPPVPPEAGAGVNTLLSLRDEPAATSPFNFVVIAAVGLVLGVVLAPWAEGWYRRLLAGK